MAIIYTIKGAFVRFLFLLHTWLCVYRLVEESGHWGWWMMAAVSAVLFFVEAAITLEYKKHGEWRR